jgi:hypothetical protein
VVVVEGDTIGSRGKTDAKVRASIVAFLVV